MKKKLTSVLLFLALSAGNSSTEVNFFFINTLIY